MPALDIQRLKLPQGRLDPKVLWPRLSEDASDELLAGYLADGVVQATAAPISAGPDRDAAAIEWAYWRAFDEVHKRLLINPSSISLGGGEGSANWLLTQIQDVEAQALAARDAFYAIVERVLSVEVVGHVTRSSACVPTSFTL